MCIGAAISGIASIAGGAMQASAAKDASAAQVAAAREQMELQERMLQQQLALQNEMYQTTRGDLSPYRQAGIPAIGAANYLLGLGNAPMVGGTPAEVVDNGDGTYSVGGREFNNIGAAEAFAVQNPVGGTPYSFTTSPGYQFARKENLDAIEGSAAARGGLYSGAAMQALGERANQLANLEFGNNFNRVMSVAGLGANAAAQTGQAAMQNAQMGSNSYLNNAQLGSNSLANMGDAQAAGIMGAANAWNNTLGDLSGLFGYQSKIWQPSSTEAQPTTQTSSWISQPNYSYIGGGGR